MSPLGNVEEGFVYTANKQTLKHINTHRPPARVSAIYAQSRRGRARLRGVKKNPAVTVRAYVPFTPSDSSIGLVQKVPRAYWLFRSPHCVFVG